LSIPKDLEEAAFIDAFSYPQIFRSVILPLARPASSGSDSAVPGHVERLLAAPAAF
jgi:hypothetical protein